jgi:hypothetical protein
MLITPDDVNAVAASVTAITGAAMLGKGKQQTPAAVPAPVNVTVNGITGQELMTGILILAGVVILLAVAMLASAAIIHHGLVA